MSPGLVGAALWRRRGPPDPATDRDRPEGRAAEGLERRSGLRERARELV